MHVRHLGCTLGPVRKAAAYTLGVPFDPVGLTEIAEMLGKAHETMKQWNRQKILPKPAAKIGGRVPVWSRAEIEKWARKTGKMPSAPE